ncbi:ANTAR domain-containing protein [Streptomyces sp. NPDC004059]
MTSVGRRTAAEEAAGEEIVRLSEENAQLRRAVDSHAVIDQAIGVLVAVWRVPPADGWRVLVDVSQCLNRKLHGVAEAIIDWALGLRPLPDPVGQELETAVQRWQHA